MDQLALKEKIGVNYMLLELTGSLNSYTITELQEKLFELQKACMCYTQA